MDIVYKQAFAETLEVLKNTEQSIVKKIPQKFLDFLEENKDINYFVNIDFTKSNWEEDIKQETQAILALIYRDYIVSEEKKKQLIKEEQEENLKIENDLREMYNPDNIFQNKKEEKVVESTNLPIEIKKETLFKRLISFIKGLFKKAN